MAEGKTAPTLKELKVKAVKLGFSGDIDSYNSIRQVQGVIDVLNNQAPAIAQSEVPVAAKSIDNKQSDDKKHKSKADRMRDQLAAQPQVQIFLSLEHGESAGNVEETEVNGRRVTKTSGTIEKFIMNGYVTYVPKGKPFLVAKQIAELLGQSQVDTANAGKNISIDRDRDVKDALT